MIFETDFMKLYEELSEINISEDNKAFFTSILDELSEFNYAFIDSEGKELDDEDAMKAVVQSPEQLMDLGKGVCTDFVEYTRTKLDERNISYKVYDIACTDKDGDHPAHVFVVVENEGKFLWLEAAWHSEAGIHEYDSLEELFEDIARKHCIYDGENYLNSCEIREIKKSLVDMSQEAIYDYVDTLPITWKAAEEGLTEGKKTKKVTSVAQTKEIDLDSFLRDIGLVPISMIAPACSSSSPSGATVWAPAEPHSGGSYKKAIPQFEVISTKRLPKLVATLDDTEFPSKMFTTDDIQNNGGRKLKEVRIGDVQGNPCRGLWFRTRSGNKRYFIFGSIFYKNTQKINAATNSEVAQANKIYDAVMKKLGNL
jgi:hypothetical protein